MNFQIDHFTHYRYSVPVQLGEHLLRFLPSGNARQWVGDCYVLIDPQPLHIEESVDLWGNRQQRLSFAGETTQLFIQAHLSITTHLVDFNVYDVWQPLAPDYGNEQVVLGPYLNLLEEPDRLTAFINPLLNNAGNNLLYFLDGLNHAIHQFYHRGVRVDGPPQRPAETLVMGEGVCRDLALLFMAVCRQVGIAARFASGYQQDDGTRQVRYLHAWPEVYLPGYGWYGFDPTHGTHVGDAHVMVAAAPTAAAVMPVEGGYTFNGPLLDSTLDTEVRINTY